MTKLTLASVREHYRREFSQPRKERLFLSSMSFFGAFGATRCITHAIRKGIGPFGNISAGGRHIHHLVFGIAGLLGSGYLWLVDDETSREGADTSLSRSTSLLYGAGAAITLDEFALWLNLKDVYWAREGRVSIDAVILFGAALSAGLWGQSFFRAVAHDIATLEAWEKARGAAGRTATRAGRTAERAIRQRASG